MNLHEADLLAGGVEVVDDFLGALADRAHRDDDILRVRSAIVVEGLVVGADSLVDLVHVIDHDLRQRVIILVAGLAGLEEDIVVLSGAAGAGMLRVHGAAAELLHGVPVEHLAEILVIPHVDLLDLMGGTEAVEEVQERNLAADGGQVRDGAEVHDLLRAVGAQHRIAGLTAGIHVGVIAEDAQGMRGQGTGRNMNDARQELAGHLVHIRDHEQQALRGGIGGRQSTGSQRAVNGARSAGLRLHLRDLDLAPKQVLPVGGGILVRLVSHRRGRRDRIDGGNVGKRIGNMRGRAVAIHGFHLSCIHYDVFPPFKDY